MSVYVLRPFTPEAERRIRDSERHGPFQATYSQTEDLLVREVEMLDGRFPFVVMIDVQPGDLRLDGTLRAHARPLRPAVAVALETVQRGPLTFVAWRFHHWHDNLRAIALGLEALRKVDRYGITEHGEQYQGWSGLPPARPMGAAWTEDVALAVLGLHRIDATPDRIRAAWRELSRKHHPDAGGDAEAFRRLTDARDYLLGSAA